jgi:hypothetical protein
MCFLPNFNQFWQMVLEKKKLIGQSQTRTAMAAILELCLIGMEYGNLVQAQILTAATSWQCW